MVFPNIYPFFGKMLFPKKWSKQHKKPKNNKNNLIYSDTTAPFNISIILTTEVLNHWIFKFHCKNRRLVSKFELSWIKFILKGKQLYLLVKKIPPIFFQAVWKNNFSDDSKLCLISKFINIKDVREFYNKLYIVQNSTALISKSQLL